MLVMVAHTFVQPYLCSHFFYMFLTCYRAGIPVIVLCLALQAHAGLALGPPPLLAAVPILPGPGGGFSARYSFFLPQV